MKKLLMIALIAAIPMGMQAMGKKVNESELQAEPAAGEISVTKAANNNLAAKLEAGLKGNGNENVFFSPYSVFSALNLAYAGAVGETKVGFETLYGIQRSESFHKDFAANAKLLNESRGANELLSANALWIDSKVEVLDEYYALTRENYGSEKNKTDFSKAKESADLINKWVADNTKNKIEKLLSEGDVDAMTKIVITNAVYFKGKWEEEFNKAKTREEDFTLADGTVKKTAMMHDKREMKYAEIDGVKLGELPYKDSGLSMVVALPATGKQPVLDAALIGKFDQQAGKPEVTIAMPKFKFETPIIDLSGVLQAGGLKRAFTDAAEFPFTVGELPLQIAKVLHKAVIEVDEEGTEAAAATAVTIRLTSAPMNPLELILNRPFAFVIRDNKTGYILFQGVLATP